MHLVNHLNPFEQIFTQNLCQQTTGTRASLGLGGELAAAPDDCGRTEPVDGTILFLIRLFAQQQNNADLKVITILKITTTPAHKDEVPKYGNQVPVSRNN